MRFIAIPNYTPHRIACGLTPLALRLPLKGGVIPLSSVFFNNPIWVSLKQQVPQARKQHERANARAEAREQVFPGSIEDAHADRQPREAVDEV